MLCKECSAEAHFPAAALPGAVLTTGVSHPEDRRFPQQGDMREGKSCDVNVKPFPVMLR